MRKLILLAAAALTLATTNTIAQHFSARSDLVVLNVAVTNDKGGFVSGLTAEAFHVVEEGQPQDVSFWAEEDAAGTSGLLIDASGWMLGRGERVFAGFSEVA